MLNRRRLYPSKSVKYLGIKIDENLNWKQHIHDIAKSSTADKIFKPSYRTDSYGKNSITIGAINSWNKTQHQFSNLSLKTYSPTKTKSLLFEICIGKY